MDLSDLLHVKPNQSELYHYTSQNGLLGILDSNSIWTSKNTCLNDSSEFILALDIARDLLLARKNEEDEIFERKKIQCLLDNIKTIRKSHVFVCSFSQQRDLLSQWRAYGDEVSGISIGFKTDWLLKQASKQNYQLVKCIYDRKKQEVVLSNLINDSMAEDFNTELGNIDIERPRTYVVLPTGGDFWKRLARISPIIKHQTFEQEQEWRLISNRNFNSENLSFRIGPSYLIPYYEFKLGCPKDYLSSITIGPTPNVDLAEESIRMLLTKYNLNRTTKLHISEIPFRNW